MIHYRNVMTEPHAPMELPVVRCPSLVIITLRPLVSMVHAVIPDVRIHWPVTMIQARHVAMGTVFFFSRITIAPDGV
jgi:hypothetical protein